MFILSPATDFDKTWNVALQYYYCIYFNSFYGMLYLRA